MILQVKKNWFNFFCNAGIPGNTAHTDATTFINNCITETMLPQLNRQYLTELGTTIIGNVLSILEHTTPDPVPTTATPILHLYLPDQQKQNHYKLHLK